MKWRWLIGVPLVLAAGGCGTLMTLAHIEARESYERQRASLSAAMTKHASAFRADLAVASAVPLLDPTRAAKPDGKDAAAFLTEKLVPLPKGLAKQLDDVALGKFPGRAIDTDVADVQLAWMSELAAFDRWELLEERPVGFHTMDLPDAALLVNLGRARLLQGLTARDPKTAGREVEELARLVASTEHWEVTMTTPSLLQLVRQTYEHARAEGMDVEGWTPADRKVVDAVRRSMRAYGGALDFHADPTLHGDLLTSADARVGRCAALNDVATTYLEMEPATGDRYRESHDWIAAALAATKGTCRLTLAREAWDAPDQRALVVGTDAMCDVDDPPSCSVTAIIGSFPGMRDLQIEAFTTAAADLFSGYATNR